MRCSILIVSLCVLYNMYVGVYAYVLYYKHMHIVTFFVAMTKILDKSNLFGLTT